MPIPSISSVQPVTGTGYLDAAAPVQGTDGAAFASQLTGAVDNLQQLSATSNELALQAVTGDLDDIHNATIASTRASVTMEMVSGFRNEGVKAFNEIMRMPI